MVSQQFRNWACSFSGCDGGNPDAKTWLCGIEWGGATREGDYYKRKLREEIEAGPVTREGVPHWTPGTTSPYERNFAKLYTAIENGRVEDYVQTIDNWNPESVFKLNLYPIAFDSTDPLLWNENGLANITGLKDKYLYQIWCLMNRFPYFADQTHDFAPERIICTGVSYLTEFLQFFAGRETHVDDIEPRTIRTSEDSDAAGERTYYTLKLQKGTTLFIIPFFSGRHGLNSNYLLQQMGDRIREYPN